MTTVVAGAVAVAVALRQESEDTSLTLAPKSAGALAGPI